MSSGLRPGHDWVPNIAWPAVGRAVGSEQRYPQLSLWSNHNNPLSLYPTDVCRLCPNEQESMGAYLPWQLCFGVSKSCADIHRWGGLAHQAALAWLLFMSWSGLIYLQKLFIDFLWCRLSWGIRMRCVCIICWLQGVIISMRSLLNKTHLSPCAGQWVTCPILYLFWILWSPEDYQSLGIFLRFQDWENLFYFLLVIDKIRGTGWGLRWSKHLNKNDILTPWPDSHSLATVTKCPLHDRTVSNKGHLNWKLCGSIHFLMCFIPHHWAQYCLVNTSYVRLWQCDRHSTLQHFVFMTFSILEEQGKAQYWIYLQKVYAPCKFLEWGWL